MYNRIRDIFSLDQIVMLLIVLLIVLFLMMVWAIENHSKEKAERMTYLDIHIYKKALRGLSICFGLTYITILVILLLIAYHLIIAEL